ncbi:MAG: carboxymuconolactone decarboxylase family protein [Bacteroidota bacterium]|nr:carboxymuconolactone decarboxylase family protein [Bacteroidota bacterium]
MNTFNVPTREEVSSQNQGNFDTLKKVLGMVPNLYATIAYSDHGLSRYLSFQNAKTSLSNKEKEAVNLVVSEVNGCRYCQSAHTVLGKMNGFPDEEIIHIRQGYSTNPKLNAMIVLAKEITEKKGHVSEKALNDFYSAGYNNGNLVDLILQVSDKIAMNYLHNLTNIPIDFPIASTLEKEAA